MSLRVVAFVTETKNECNPKTNPNIHYVGFDYISFLRKTNDKLENLCEYQRNLHILLDKEYDYCIERKDVTAEEKKKKGLKRILKELDRVKKDVEYIKRICKLADSGEIFEF